MENSRRRRWYERRTEAKKINLDWVKTNCKLTNREKELLRLVYERKLVRRDQLEVISPSYRNTGKYRTTLINRAIRKMYDNNCLDKVHEQQEVGKGNFPCTVAIDRAGSILLNVPHKPRIIHNRTNYNGIEYISRSLPSNYRHILGVNQLEVETILFCEENDFKILEWRLEHLNKKQFNFGQEKIILIPDIFMVLEIRNKRFISFIEFDTGTENIRYKEPPIIRDKVQNYRRYKKSNLWVQEDWIKYLDKPKFPTLLFVTEDSKRIDFFNRKCKELGVEGLGIYHEKYLNVLKKITALIV